VAKSLRRAWFGLARSQLTRFQPSSSD